MTDSFRNAMINRALGDIKNLRATRCHLIATARLSREQRARTPRGANAATRADERTERADAATREEAQQRGLLRRHYGGQRPAASLPLCARRPCWAPVLAHASAMYQYNAQDAGDLALMPNDKVVVTEYMNNEWWKGRNERTGMEGIFPASYVRKEEKAVMPVYTPSATPAPAPSNYGNMPLDVASGAQAQQQQPAGEPSKMEANGKKFGKKLGNAAIFGAGATIGGKIVNGIF
ncbi:hypothetical protein HRS9139_02711 [Pyrenophora teres f. teres]|nr:hypothetical protein HRS9139_02711 [Pyrenophora teres f. teres]